MYTWGWSKYGQTGHGDRTPRLLPKRVDHEFAKDLVAVSAGTKHTAAIDKKGHAVTFGDGGNGQLGLGQNNTGEQLEPRRIDKCMEAGVNFVSLSCGSIHTCFVTLEGELDLCGFGEHFTPDESQHFFYDPKQIEMPEPVKQISCGQSHIVALSTTGNVYTWGSGDYGQLGYGVYGNCSTPRLVLEDKGMEQVAAGRYHTLALSNMGVLYSWGCGENGQLGQNSDDNVPLPTVVAPILGSVVGQVACGEHHTAVLSSAPWTKLSVNMQEWTNADKTELAKKQVRPPLFTQSTLPTQPTNPIDPQHRAWTWRRVFRKPMMTR
jgi:alpha-tubulin suppressor-like RCC1 family protein